MITAHNNILYREEQKPILYDYFYEPENTALPVIIFCHGYKGFKDWGTWNLMAQAFAKANFLFIKFNFSHNGGTINQPIDFPDLDSFGHNNYSKEVQDLNDIISWVTTSKLPINTNRIYLMGHSRAGGITSIVASHNRHIKKLITLAGVSDYEIRFPKANDLEKWKETGVYYVKNGRTGQDMPHYYQFYQDYIKHKDLLNIKKAVERLDIPHLIIHGEQDQSVSIQEAYDIQSWRSQTQLHIIPNTGHTFGAVHPWKEKDLPLALKEVVQRSIVHFGDE